jgi:hypothetical protein
MTMTASGFASCASAERYVKQLVSHWSHKMAATWDSGHAEFPFSGTTHVTMDCTAEGIAITLTTTDTEQNLAMRGVIERHIDRFAFREAPLTYRWSEQ